MPRILRLLLLGAVGVGLIGIGVTVAGRPAAPAPPVLVSSLPTPTAMVAEAPLHSAAGQTVEDGWTVIRYALAAGDTLIVRLSDGALRSCDFKIHAGTRRGTERVRLGIDVDYTIVPAGQAEVAVAGMARSCAESWTTTD